MVIKMEIAHLHMTLCGLINALTISCQLWLIRFVIWPNIFIATSQQVVEN